MRVVYGNRRGIMNVDPVGFDAELSTLYQWSFLGIPLYWHWSQWREATKRRADVLILVWNIQYLSLIPALIRAKFNGVRTVLWGHGHSKRETNLRRKLRYVVAKLADGVVFYDVKSARQCIEKGWLPASKTFVAPNAIDGARILNQRAILLESPEELRAFQKEERIAPKKTILFVSRLHRANRLDLLLEACSTLKVSDVITEIVIIGKGDEEQARLAQIAATLKIAENVRFVGPIYQESELAKWFLSARLFCYPENMGLSLYHAMLYGLPVVTADEASCHGPEYHCVTNNETAVLYRRGVVQDLAAKLRHCLEDDLYHRKISYNSLRYARQNINVEGMVKGLMQSVMEARR